MDITTYMFLAVSPIVFVWHLAMSSWIAAAGFAGVAGLATVGAIRQHQIDADWRELTR